MLGIKLVSSLSSPVVLSFHDSISNQNSFKFNASFFEELTCIICIYQSAGKVRKIHSTIWLSRNPEVIGFKFWKFFKPQLQSIHWISCSSWLIVDIIFIFVDGKSNSRRWFKEEHVCVLIPRVWVFIASIIHGSWFHHIGSNLLCKS